MVKIATQCINFFFVYQCCKICYIRMAIFTTLRGKIHNSIQHKLQNSMEVDSVGIIAILSMSYINTRIVKTQKSVAKIPRVPVENQITTVSVVKIAIIFSPCTSGFQSVLDRGVEGVWGKKNKHCLFGDLCEASRAKSPK